MSTPTHTSRSVDRTRLDELGKTAAELSATSGIPLTEAVVRTVGMEKLNAQQVRRVVEAANHDAYSRKYAQTSGRMRAVHFDDGPADPEVVISALKTAAAPREKVAACTEYDLPPDFSTYTAAPMETPFRTPAGVRQDIFALQAKLGFAHEEAVAGIEVAREDMREAFSRLSEHTKLALRSGASADDIVGGWISAHGELATVAASRLGMTLTGIKTAGIVINPEHAVMTSFGEFAQATESFQAYQDARVGVETELGRIGDWLQRKAAA